MVHSEAGNSIHPHKKAKSTKKRGYRKKLSLAFGLGVNDD
jgi:hypothetical protein